MKYNIYLFNILNKYTENLFYHHGHTLIFVQHFIFIIIFFYFMQNNPF